MDSLLGFLGHNNSGGTPQKTELLFKENNLNAGGQHLSNDTFNNMWLMLLETIAVNQMNEVKEEKKLSTGAEDKICLLQEQLEKLQADNRDLKLLRNKVDVVYKDLVKEEEVALQAFVEHATSLLTKYNAELGRLESINQGKREQIETLEKENKELYSECARLENEVQKMDDEVTYKNHSYIQSIMKQ
ncbi:unnamed protein product [Bursaphelenchus okinawaensis]|uniref:Uncharacterized protein n=1 Tax=Bursaphelenchus okinawaensis TaxID=465554 RepID=A0A811KAH2_9BILA|nr:unnamed protein product [Bursaphelenchus okinawaensis]CAG9095771.1 unnamed protein product [Bursaphelenchus okinawaensis]